MSPTFKETLRREKQVIIKGQTPLFRLTKWIVILVIFALITIWKDIEVALIVLLAFAVLGIILHFFFRWKTKGWTQSWGLYKKIPLN